MPGIGLGMSGFGAPSTISMWLIHLSPLLPRNRDSAPPHATPSESIEQAKHVHVWCSMGTTFPKAFAT